MDCLKAAVYNGADEVYLGINDFNARNNVDGFTLATLEEAVDFAHLYGVKVLLAINILFSDTELKSAVNTVVKAYNMGVDAFIIQDLGLIKLLSTHYPQMELHASTQMGIHNLEGVKDLEKYNIKRVVLARETPLEEIKRIKENSNIELEYFCQGALCVSFSGNCYLSSYLFGASGNRGRCKQPCRLSYTLEKSGRQLKTGYLLSAKDFNIIKRLPHLEAAGIDVIKIEGRARRPFYVATATSEYYKALHGKSPNEDNLKLAFNRTYTAGYFDGNGKIISDIQNHIGIKIGKVDKVNLGKNFNQIYFSSTKDLSPKSTFKFLGSTETAITAYDLQRLSATKYMLTTTQKVKEGDVVHLIVDNQLEAKSLAYTAKKPISIDVSAYPNMPISARVTIDDICFDVEGTTCLPAENHPLTDDEILQNFAKSQMFDASLTVNTAGAFLPKKDQNDFRRKVYDSAYSCLVARYKKELSAFASEPRGAIVPFKDFTMVETLPFSAPTKNVVYSPETYTLKDVTKFIELCKKEGKTPYLDTPNFALKEDIAILKDIVDKTNVAIVANNYYALSFDTQLVIGGGLNVYNSIAAAELARPCITAESDVATKSAFPYMTLRHCPIKSHLNSTCEKCLYSDGYTYRMDNGKLLKLKRKKLTSCTFYLVE